MACEECNDTWIIKTEAIDLGRPYYSKEHGGMVYNISSKGDWKDTPCYCLDDDKDKKDGNGI